MQQRQLRLGDVLDDYCPRERRLTNHVVVAMVGNDVKQTRCTTCEAEHEYKQARLPRLRRKADTAALAPGGIPKLREAAPAAVSAASDADARASEIEIADAPPVAAPPPEEQPPAQASSGDAETEPADDEGPVHRPLIRASLPRLEGAPPPSRPVTDFTIRQPAGNRHNRFRARHAGGGHQSQQSQGNRSGGYGGGGQMRGGGGRHGGGQPQSNRSQSQHGQGRKRSR
jgi:uncharacterized membrane protein YgcG